MEDFLGISPKSTGITKFFWRKSNQYGEMDQCLNFHKDLLTDVKSYCPWRVKK